MHHGQDHAHSEDTASAHLTNHELDREKRKKEKRKVHLSSDNEITGEIHSHQLFIMREHGAK